MARGREGDLEKEDAVSCVWLIPCRFHRLLNARSDGKGGLLGEHRVGEFERTKLAMWDFFLLVSRPSGDSSVLLSASCNRDGLRLVSLSVGSYIFWFDLPLRVGAHGYSVVFLYGKT